MGAFRGSEHSGTEKETGNKPQTIRKHSYGLRRMALGALGHCIEKKSNVLEDVMVERHHVVTSAVPHQGPDHPEPFRC